MQEHRIPVAIRGSSARGIAGMRTIRDLARRVRTVARRLLGRSPRPRRTYSWSIGIYAGPSPIALGAATGVTNPVLTRQHVSDVSAAFVADPFMIEAGERWYMFFEVMNRTTAKGEIGLAVSEDAHRWAYDSLVLVEPFHLSYPYVFEWRGEHFMVPESHQRGAVCLYRSKRFPRDWEMIETLVEADSPADASPFYWRNRWWMFLETEPTTRHVLRLYQAETLAGPWREHPASPVVRGNPHTARPAGRVLTSDEGIIRFAQDCDPRYGLSVSAYRVELASAAYREFQLGSGPILSGTGHGWNADGMHHVDAHRLADGTWIACVDGWIDVDSKELYG
jgi:hypothetical protein